MTTCCRMLEQGDCPNPVVPGKTLCREHLDQEVRDIRAYLRTNPEPSKFRTDEANLLRDLLK